ncbi:hypothetical protein C0992_010478 [Termitomyces sp. T32_za158]|nr:hypothetical protein C0992_012498 [Termitomyces sp. T32_za158]KAG6896073.1 hypothetical protein C0992_010478 [Termitomyces sp. T32_za158]
MAMFHYIPVASHSYPPPHLSDPRDRYFAALAAVQAAEVDYLAAEAARREEDDLRRRLAEIQYRKQEQALHHHLAPYTYPHIYPSYDRLAILRQQLEEEERLRFLALREAELEKRSLREQLVMELETAHLRRAREEALHLKQGQKGKARFQALLGQSVKPLVAINLMSMLLLLSTLLNGFLKSLKRLLLSNRYVAVKTRRFFFDEE